MRRLLPAAAVALLSLGLPTLLPSYTMHVLDSGMIAAIAVVGLNFTFGWAGLISLAQAAFIGTGAYASALLTTRAGLPIWAAWPLAVLATCLGATLFALPMLRLRGHFLALATLGFTVSCGIVASGWRDGLGGTDGLSGIASPSVFGIALDTDGRYFYLLWAALLVACLLADRVRHSQLGIALVAVRDDEIAASAASIDVPRTKLRAFVLGAGFAGAAGVLFAHFALYVAPDDFNLSQSILYLVMLIVGGEGSIAGAVLGALLLTFLPEWLRFLGMYYLTVYGGLTLLVLIFLPGGLASLVRRRAGALPG